MTGGKLVVVTSNSFESLWTHIYNVLFFDSPLVNPSPNIAFGTISYPPNVNNILAAS